MVAMFILLKGNVEFSDVIKYLGSNLVFANFISPDMGGLLANAHNPAINASLWTLKIEVMFYLSVPLLWWMVKRSGIKVLSIIYLASALFAAVAIYYGHESWAKQLFGQLRFFIVGFLLYHFRDRFNFTPLVSILLAISLFVICTVRKNLFPEYVSLFVDPLIVGGLVFICALRLPVYVLKYDISYGVYLIHAPLIQIALLLGLFVNSISFLLFLVAIVCVLAFVAEKLVRKSG